MSLFVIIIHNTIIIIVLGQNLEKALFFKCELCVRTYTMGFKIYSSEAYINGILLLLLF